MKKNNIAFTFSSAEVNKIGQSFIKVVELLTGKLTLKKLYDQYLIENNPPENFWHDALAKLKLNVKTHFSYSTKIPDTGRLIVIANHAFGVADGISICSLISSVRQDYRIITHKVLRQAEAVKDKIIPIDFTPTKEARYENIKARKLAEEILNNNGVLVIFPSGQISTKKKLNKFTKADDGEWKQFTSKLAIRTQSPILPLYFEGHNSQLFHIANKIGLVFRYSLMMYELKRKIGDTITIHIGDVIPYTTLQEIADLKEITKFLRQKTYSLDPSNLSN